MQTPSTKASILKPIHSRRRRTPGTICLCVIDPATCPQCTRPAEAQSPRAEALKTRSVTFAPAVQICYFQEHDTPRGVADDDRIATDTPRLTEVSPSDARESMVHDDCSIPPEVL
ncbi:hypothetical protein Tdes44962_MAKER10127 [Teratosphaeria destructans]|uniref:Uncharacterized protein n=1 Tax=Teratosphaeria destructans TaxID=418781 RepID=A0A9W7SNL6_9PEZI|nr:hypothetical protein Tdes44962_MAKER10127 [Teratosphaeria destructans]